MKKLHTLPCFFFLQYIIQTRLPTPKTGRLLKPFLISVCMTWSLVCSLTRITDRRHHWWDVLAGMVLGCIGVAYTVRLIDSKVKRMFDSTRISSSTTTLLDVKNKDATSVIIWEIILWIGNYVKFLFFIGVIVIEFLWKCFYISLLVMTRRKSSVFLINWVILSVLTRYFGTVGR